MGLMPLAVLVGLAVGFLTGGRPRHLGERTFHLWPLLLVGVLCQLAGELGALGSGAHLLVLASYVALGCFVAANLRLTGMGVVLLGLAMNFATVAVNGGMPVEDRAIVAAGLAEDPAEIDEIDFRAKRHRMTGEDTLYWLSDIVPVRLLGTGQVLSFGDLVMCVGVADLLANLLHPFPRRRGRALSDRQRTTRGTNAPPPQTASAALLGDAGDEVVDLRTLDRSSAASVPGEPRS